MKLAFPYFSKPFHLWNDTSNIQLGVMLVQDNKPLGLYTHKLNTTQHNYSVNDKQLLGLVDGVKAFDGTICGMNFTIHTDHLNLLI